MDKQKKVRKHVFTLVELLVVLLILGVLVGLAVPRYMDAQKSARLRSFAANTREIESALETYRLSNSTDGNKYLDNLSELTSYFTQPPINPYTGKSMLSDNPEESGLRYENHDNDYTLCVTQLDVDDVNNNGNRNESIPVASHIAKNDVGETCSVVTGTIEPVDDVNNNGNSVVTGPIEPYIMLSEWFSEAVLFRASNGNVLFFRDDTNKEFVNLATLTQYGDGIILDRTLISATTITIDYTNGLSAFQIKGDVSTNGNYMICPSYKSSILPPYYWINCEATTKDTFMIWSNNADDSVIEFTVNIPEIEISGSNGVIEIGLTDFYLRYDAKSRTIHLMFGDGEILLGGWGTGITPYTGPHTFRFEFHHGKAGIKMDNEVLLPETHFDSHSFNENGTRFFVKNISTNQAVQIGTIAITIGEYEFATTGTYISSIYDISTPNFITGTTDVRVNLNKFDQLEQYTDFTLEYQLSLNGGATWGDWQPVALYTENNWENYYVGVSSDFPRNISLENARIRLRVTLSTNNTKFSPEIEEVNFVIYNALAQT